MADDHLLTIGELAAYLQVSRSTIDRHVHEGMPCVDVGRHDSRRRPKRMLRFELGSVLGWLEEKE